MFAKIAGFELRYQLRQPVFWVTAIIFFLLTFGATTVSQVTIGSTDNVHKNSPFVISQVTLIMSLFYMFVTTAFVSNVVVRDDETGFGPIIRATPVTRFDYLNGRFLGAFLAASLGFLFIPLGILVGSFMPWVDSELLGPNRLSDYAFAYFAIGLPAVLLTSALFFAVATVTRSMMWTYVGVIAFLIVYTVVTGLLGRKPELETTIAYAEPFGFGAYFHATKYWTATERNTLTPALDGILLVNRIAALGVSFLFLVIANALFRSGSKGAKLKKQEKLRALVETEAHTAPAGRLPKPQFDGVTARAQLWKRTRFEMAQVFKSPAYFVLLALGLFNAIGGLYFNRELYGTEIYPVTRVVITTLRGAFSIIPVIVAVYYAGELVWRERDRKTHEIVDASAAPDWTFAFPKIVAIALVLISTNLVSVLAGVLVQTLKGYSDYELGKYLAWYVLPASIGATMLAIQAVFFQSIVPHKFVGWGLMVIYLIFTIALSNMGFQDNLYQYGGSPGVPLSDMNGQGHFWIARAWFDLYWGAFALILTILSFGLWRRGTETRLTPRLARLPRRLKGGVGLTAALALAVFAATGAFIYLNTHVWNEYRTSIDNEKNLADREKALLRFEHAPEPTTVSVKLDLDLHPHEARLTTRGEYVLENRTNAPISDVHLQLDRNTKLVRLDLPGASLAKEYKEHNFRIYRFAQPLAPGARTTLSFETLREQHGFRNDGNAQIGIVDNGTFLNNSQFTPLIGIDRSGFLQDRAKRRKYGLPPELRPAKLEDDSARVKNYVGDAPWVMSDITVTTDADQTPVAPGYKVSDVTRGGRRTAEFKTDAPILAFFSVQSARYAEKHVNYKGVDIGVYYYPGHPWNVDRMISAAERGLDYFQPNFGPYQFRQLRFLEFPDLGPGSQFAQSFANTVPWSEGLGFTAHVAKPEDIDYVTYVGAHELGHQWWAHQEVSAEMQGGTMLVETLAQYSALMVMEKAYGPEHIRKFLKYELDTYLRSRGGEVVEELPLERVENQPYIHYRKGAVVMYLLKDQIGEEAVNRALRSFLADWKFKGPPYPASKDLIAKFRAEAPADKQQLITDLFEKITLYDLKAKDLTVKKRADGRYDVRLTVEAGKFYANGKGKQTKADVSGESFDIGLFTDKPGDKAFGSKSVLLFQRVPLKSGTQVFDFVVDKAPKFGGVDPYNKFIDRNSEDNVVQAGG
jgi:aminopeptidase N